MRAGPGGNYVRNTMSARDAGNVQAFAKRTTKYDLEKFNDEYWKRFETLLIEAAKRNIIVQIEVWATFDYYREPWAGNPFNPKNNINYKAGDSGLPLVVNSHPGQTRNNFFRSVPGAKNLEVTLRHQRRFVEKILSYSLKYPNVLYCMDNETSVTPKWGAYWAKFIGDTAAKQGKKIETTEMWDDWDVTGGRHNASVGHPEVYSFIEVSQNNHQKGQKHYDNPQAIRRRIKDRPCPINNVKIYGSDRGKFGKSRDGVERFWRNIFGGLASARFHRPAAGLGLDKTAQRMIRSARQVTGAFDIFSCQPHNDLLTDRRDNEAYCVANPPHEYAVYFPAAGQVSLNVKSSPRPRQLHWFDIDAGQWKPAEKVAGQKLALQTPGPGQWAAVITRKK